MLRCVNEVTEWECLTEYCADVSLCDQCHRIGISDRALPWCFAVWTMSQNRNVWHISHWCCTAWSMSQTGNFWQSIALMFRCVNDVTEWEFLTDDHTDVVMCDWCLSQNGNFWQSIALMFGCVIDVTEWECLTEHHTDVELCEWCHRLGMFNRASHWCCAVWMMSQNGNV